MAYPDPQFNVAQHVAVSFGGTALATGTGTAVTATLPDSLPFLKAGIVKGAAIVTKTAPAGTVTGGVIDFLNGTNTVGSITAVATAGGAAFGTFTSSNGTFTASGVLTAQVRGTTTQGTGAQAGGFSIFVDVQDLFV